MGNDEAALSQLLLDLQQQFLVKILGKLHTFLGLQVQRSGTELLLHQTSYAKALLDKAGMTDCHPLQTPLSAKTPTSPADESPFSDPYLYRSLAGSLQYLTITRPDLSFAVNQVCQHMNKPLNYHFQMLKRILRYLKGTVSAGLPIQLGNFTLSAYADADWAGDKIDRKSTSGYCVFLGRTLISWSAKKQSTISRSSTEAEYRALTAAATEIVWLRRLLQDFNIPCNIPTLLYCDSVSAISLANNPVFHARTKHIEIDQHYIRECIKSKIITLHHISTNDQTADIFTKSLPITRFLLLRNKLTLCTRTVNLRGTVKQTKQSGTTPVNMKISTSQGSNRKQSSRPCRLKKEITEASQQRITRQ
ncbi:hypothetical protein KFK09_001401 [Dendrobium nobile]|uniref:Mitochondrial protein n=1 Tax=Dendrobium nobile TaxID=94219 RepID=A0A8T3C7C5_DENNO|nr:hypothetical protein KFK09_001401 [Dendrobium nobile]